MLQKLLLALVGLLSSPSFLARFKLPHLIQTTCGAWVVILSSASPCLHGQSALPKNYNSTEIFPIESSSLAPSHPQDTVEGFHHYLSQILHNPNPSYLSQSTFFFSLLHIKLQQCWTFYVSLNRNYYFKLLEYRLKFSPSYLLDNSHSTLLIDG